VLLVDADMRVSRLAAYLGAPGAPGLSDYLRGAAAEAAVIQTNANGSLFFVPAGDPAKNPTELLTAGRFQSLLERLAPMFDWIIVDTPPVLPVSDASVLAGACDGVLVVVRAAATGCELVEAALKELPAAKVLGVVLNRAEEELPRGAYVYYARMAGGRPAESTGPSSRLRVR
jgi:capsular exopolysaccharide synthesis family protein